MGKDKSGDFTVARNDNSDHEGAVALNGEGGLVSVGKPASASADQRIRMPRSRHRKRGHSPDPVGACLRCSRRPQTTLPVGRSTGFT